MQEALQTARDLLAKSGGKLVLPVDAVISDLGPKDNGQMQTVKADAVPAGWRTLIVSLAASDARLAAFRWGSLAVAAVLEAEALRLGSHLHWLDPLPEEADGGPALGLRGTWQS